MVCVNKLKAFRKEAGLTQAQMGKKLGISESGYCLIENGKRKLTVKMAVDIASILKIEPNNIFLSANFAKRQVKGRATGTEGR